MLNPEAPLFIIVRDFDASVADPVNDFRCVENPEFPEQLRMENGSLKSRGLDQMSRQAEEVTKSQGRSQRDENSEDDERLGTEEANQRVESFNGNLTLQLNVAYH